jgi:hypothetical protein
MEEWKTQLLTFLEENRPQKEYSSTSWLHRVLKEDYMDTMENINAPVSSHTGPLLCHFASAGNNPYFLEDIQNAKKAIFLLLSLGADPNVVDKRGKTPLFHALMDNTGTEVKREVLRLLLEWGADIHHTYTDDQDLLIFFCSELSQHFSCYENNAMYVVVDENVSWLLEHGADPRRKDKHGKTAVDHLKAYEWHNKSVPKAIAILEGKDVACSTSKPLICSRCKRNYSPLAQRDWDGHLICKTCYTDLVLAPFRGILWDD